jgi:hypothetical protein
MASESFWSSACEYALKKPLDTRLLILRACSGATVSELRVMPLCATAAAAVPVAVVALLCSL